MTAIPHQRRTVWIVWSLILAALLAGAFLALWVYSAASRMSYEAASQLLNSLAADGKVSSFTPVLFEQLRGFMLVFGLGMLVIALVWVLGFRRSSEWAGNSWYEMHAFVTADRAQIRSVRQSAAAAPAASLLIPAAFWAVYAWFGLSLRQTALFRYYNMLFDADVPYVIPALTSWGGQSERHPLLAWFFSPFGAALTVLFDSPAVAAVIVNSFAGALTIWLVLLILFRLGIRPFTAVLWAGVVGLTTTHVFFSSIPESYIFAASSLALGLYLMLAYPGNLLYAIPAGIYTFGITITNIVHSSISFWCGLGGIETGSRERLRRFFLFLFTVVLLAVLLNLALIFVTRIGSIFLLPDVYRENYQYVERDPTASLASRVGLLVEDLFLFNLAGPNLYLTGLELHDDAGQIPVLPPGTLDADQYNRYSFATYIDSSWQHAALPAQAAWVIWLALLAAGLLGIVLRRLYRSPFFLAIALSLVFNFIFHFFWGWDPFLYSPHWTFMVVLLAAFGIGNPRYELPLQLLLLVLLSALAWNNAQLLMRVSFFFTG